MTQTPFFDALHFAPSADEHASLLPQSVAQSVWYALQTEGVVTDLTIRPQKIGITKK